MVINIQSTSIYSILRAFQPFCYLSTNTTGYFSFKTIVFVKKKQESVWQATLFLARRQKIEDRKKRKVSHSKKSVRDCFLVFLDFLIFIFENSLIFRKDVRDLFEWFTTQKKDQLSFESAITWKLNGQSDWTKIEYFSSREQKTSNEELKAKISILNHSSATPCVGCDERTNALFWTQKWKLRPIEWDVCNLSCDNVC